MNWRRETVKMAVPPGNRRGEVAPVCVDGVFLIHPVVFVVKIDGLFYFQDSPSLSVCRYATLGYIQCRKS